MQNNFVNRGRQEIEYAGFWVRLAAYCIDSAIVWAGLLFVKLAMGIFSVSGVGILEAHLLFRYSARDIILYVFEVLYFILLTYGTGTTPGKRLLNLRVVNADLSPGLSLVDVVYRETVGRICGRLAADARRWEDSYAACLSGSDISWRALTVRKEGFMI